MFKNEVMVELMVPREPESERRILEFYKEIKWPTWRSSKEGELIYTRPEPWGIRGPAIAYWLTENEHKVAHFEQNTTPEPSEFAVGARLPFLNDLVEVSFILPIWGADSNWVESSYRRGGELLARHCHVPLREWAGTSEFRFSDPFNYSLRVTGDPGYELRN